MVARLKELHPEVPILGFPRAANAQTARFVRETGVDGVSCDTSMPLSLMAGEVADTGAVVQGNLDPLLLVAGGDALDRRVGEILENMNGKKFVFQPWAWNRATDASGARRATGCGRAGGGLIF